MKSASAITLILVILLAIITGYYLYQVGPTLLRSPRASNSSCTNGASNPPGCNDNNTSSSCTDPQSINSHVYHPARLQAVRSCATAAGIVDLVRQEPDGDLHIRLHLDPAYANMTNSANDQYQYGDLVVEIICVGTVTQADAVDACMNYQNPITVPTNGQHITVTGPYVLDTEHSYWAEIHPVYSLKVDSTALIESIVHLTSERLTIVYPDSSSYRWLGPSRTITGYATVNPGEQFTDDLELYSTSDYTEQINSIIILTPGFSITSITPNPPIQFDPQATVDITMTIQTPSTAYQGAIDLQIVAS